jgi:phosphoribosylamine--glycine ligase
MRVLVVGGGGREHALCWAIARSSLCDELICAPGNAGIADVAECIDVGAEDVDAIVALSKEREVDFVVIGPEGPLVAGLVDRLSDIGIKAFGPSASAALLEGSKGFMKDLSHRCGVPSAAYGRFTDPARAKSFIAKQGAPIVVKADGLAAGKGVILCYTEAEAIAAINSIMIDKAFGPAGGEIVIEEFLYGEEASFFALVDGKTAVPLVSAQDHKAAFDGDKGPNTGGMGAYSPAPAVTDAMADAIMENIVKPVIAGMATDGRVFKGVLFAGLMIGPKGPKLLEFNVRFGDPECQALVMRLKSDLLEALVACADGTLDTIDLQWHDDAAMTVVMAANGYPGAYDKRSEIRSLDTAEAVDGVTVFHAGTRREGEHIFSDGGRVLGVTARGATIAEAQSRAYAGIDRIDWPGGFCRRDIGWRALGH